MQYVEENDRLRAILGEWSARAAKVLLVQCYCVFMAFVLVLVIISLSIFNSLNVHWRQNGCQTSNCGKTLRSLEVIYTKSRRPDFSCLRNMYIFGVL